LVIVLRVNAVIVLAALVPAVMPFAWMQASHRGLGLGELPESPVIGYLTRSCSLLYASNGVLLFYLSLDVRRHLGVIGCLGALGIAFGLALLLVDWAVGMPPWWTAAEGPLIAVVGAVFVWLVTCAKGGEGRSG